MRVLYVASTVAGILAFPMVNDARADDRCAQYIRYESVTYENNIRTTLSLLQTINRENFSEKKRSFMGDVEVPLKNIPVKAFASYDEFQQERSKVNDVFKFDLDEQQSLRYLESKIPQGSWNAVHQCLSNTYGLHAALEYVTKDNVYLRLHYKSDINNPTSLQGLKYEVNGKDIQTSSVIPHDHSLPLVYRRDPQKEFTFRAHGQGHLTSLLRVPAEPEIFLPQRKGWVFASQNTSSPYTFKAGHIIECESRAKVAGTHQNGQSSEHVFSGSNDVFIHHPHAVVGDSHYSKISVNGSVIMYNNHDAGFRLHTITVTCN